MEIPTNAMTITATITHEVGEVRETYSTIVLVQTHRLIEMQAAMDMVWKATMNQIPADKPGLSSHLVDVVTHVSGVPCPNCDCTFSFEITEGEASPTRKDPYNGFGNGGDGS